MRLRLDLCDSLGALLKNEIKEDCIIGFAEPDLEFYLYPSKLLNGIPREVIFIDGSRYDDIIMQMIVRFWCRGELGSNYFSMTFKRHEIEALYTYLCMVTGKIKKDDKKIVKLMKEGVILPE